MERAFRWHRSRRAGIAIPLVLALLFRACIPAGFMPVLNGDAGLTYMLCPGSTSAEPAHHHHDHAGSTEQPAPLGADPHREAARDHGLCLFAAGAAVAPLPAGAEPSPNQIDDSPVFSRQEQTFFAPAIVRAQCARAPPFSEIV